MNITIVDNEKATFLSKDVTVAAIIVMETVTYFLFIFLDLYLKISEQ